MTDINRMTPLMNLKVIGDTPEDLGILSCSSNLTLKEQFKKTNSNFAHQQVSSPAREFFAQEEEYEYCPHCSRKFFSGRLKLHLKSCKEGKPHKPMRVKATEEKLQKNLSEGPDTLEVKPQSSNKIESESKYRPASMEIEDNDNKFQTSADHSHRLKAEDGRVGCLICNRFFHEDRIAKHEKACQKSHKKRQVFDTTQQRAISEQGKDIKHDNPEPNKIKKSLIKEKATDESPHEDRKGKKASGWRTQHDNFIENIRFNRKVKEMEARGEDTSKLVAPTIVGDNYVQCSYCFRKFAPATAERHIPKCKNIFNRPKPPNGLRIEKLEYIQKVDRSKSDFALKKDAMKIRKSTDVDEKDTTSPTDPFSINGKALTQRTPKSNFSLSSYEMHNSDKAHKTLASPKGDLKLRPLKNLKADSKMILRKDDFENSGRHTILPEIKRYEIEGEEIKGLDTRKRSPSGPSRDQKKVFTSPMPKKDDLLQHYQDLVTRACKYATEPCPYCFRKFAHNAAERHIPICKMLQTRNLLKKFEEKNLLDIERKVLRINPSNSAFKTSFSKKLLPNASAIHFEMIIKEGQTERLEKSFVEKRIINSERRPQPVKQSQIEAVLEKSLPSKKPKLISTVSPLCTSCGSKLAQQHKFCGHCGHKKIET